MMMFSDKEVRMIFEMEAKRTQAALLRGLVIGLSIGSVVSFIMYELVLPLIQLLLINFF